ncbi:MAG TPA: SIR2 family protein [Pseudonocardia sp.]|nr:SIR2 family protein [Pseudonocardia sp.]
MAHVFVAPGDVTRLAADAWLLPTDRTLSIRAAWFARVPALHHTIDTLGDHAHRLRDGTAHALVLPGWAETTPQPVLVAVPFDGVREAGQVVAPLQEALRAAAGAARVRVDLRRASARRGLPLVGLPLFGSAGGGGDLLRGELIRTVLDVAGAIAQDEHVDVALVLREPSDLAQAHALRRATAGSWDELDDALVDRARLLAGHARAGRLVPFIGAGVSATAGLPLWTDLVADLAEGRLPDDERRDFQQLDVLDQAHVLRHMYPDRASFARAVADRTDAGRYGLAPALLAGLPTREAVTLNYDELYELAASDMGRRTAVLPEEAVGSGGRWLLKLHGTVRRPETIVLTREDYLSYGRGREALSALAKAMLLTRHLLFVGFGLADDHFHELMHDVREVLPPDRLEARLGTAVLLSTSPLRQRMWGGELDLVDVGGDGIPEQARRLEIFLDCLLAHADQGLSFFLDDRYRHRLDDTELRLRDRLLRLVAETTPAERATVAWSRLAATLGSLGLPGQ